MAVSVLCTASLDVGLGWVVEVDVHGPTRTGVVTADTTTSTASNGVILLLVGDNSVCSSFDTLVDFYEGNILDFVESVRLLGR